MIRTNLKLLFSRKFCKKVVISSYNMLLTLYDSLQIVFSAFYISKMDKHIIFPASSNARSSAWCLPCVSLTIRIFMLLPRSISLPAGFLLLEVLFPCGSIYFSALVSSPLLYIRIPEHRRSDHNRNHSHRQSRVQFVLQSSHGLRLLFHPEILLQPHRQILRYAHRPEPLPVCPEGFCSLYHKKYPLRQISQNKFQVPYPDSQSQAGIICKNNIVD